MNMGKNRKRKREHFAQDESGKDKRSFHGASASTGFGNTTYPSLQFSVAKMFSKAGSHRGKAFLQMEDVHALVLSALGIRPPPSPRSWFKLETTEHENVPKVVVTMVSGLTPSIYAGFDQSFANLQSTFAGQQCPLLMPGSPHFVKDALSSFLTVHLTTDEVLKQRKGEPPPSSTPTSLRLRCVLHLRHLVIHGYPVRSEWLDSDQSFFAGNADVRDDFFELPCESTQVVASSGTATDMASSPVSRESVLLSAETGSSSEETSGTAPATQYDCPVGAEEEPAMFAIDCEMCTTCEGPELTHIAVIDEQHTCIYQTLVKPRNAIVDYLTQYSGITSESLENVTTRLEDVQQELSKLIPSSAILVGHALENDLLALKMTHRRVIDTCLLFAEGRQYKPKLRYLAKDFLGLDIQTGEQGHDPAEDARATMKLAQHHLRKERSSKSNVMKDSLFSLVDRCNKKGLIVDKPLTCARHCHGNTVAVPVASDEEAVHRGLSLLCKADFMFLRLTELSSYLGHNYDKAMESHEELAAVLGHIDCAVQQVYDQLPLHSLMVVLFDRGDGRLIKREKEKENCTAQKLATAIQHARSSMFFAKLKE